MTNQSINQIRCMKRYKHFFINITTAQWRTTRRQNKAEEVATEQQN